MIRLNQLLKEETFTATNKQSGKTSVFKSKDSRDAAIKAGTHDAMKDKEQPKSAPKAAGNSMFGGDYAKDRGGEAPKADKTTSTPNADMGVDKVVYNKRTKTVGIVRMADERGETKTDADGNVNTDELEPYNPMKYPHQKDAQVAPSTTKEIDSRGLWKPFSQSNSTTSKEKSQYDDPTYWKDDKRSDTSGYYDDDDDEEGGVDAMVQLTSDRLNKVEKALNDELKLEDNGFETTRESGGGGGGWEGPMTIISKDIDYDNGYNCLSIGSGENDGKFSIGFYNQDGEPVFDDEDYGSLTGDKVLSAKQTYKIGKALMAMPEVQKFIKGEITSDEFAAVHDKIKSKFNKSKNEGIIRLTNLLKEGLGPDNAMVAAISDALKKELGVDNVKVKKYNQGRARQGYNFFPDGTKNGLYIDEAYDGIWSIYTIKPNEFPIHNHWEISSLPVDIEDKQTALKAALAVIKKFKKDLQ